MIFILNIYKWEKKKGFSPVLFLLFILNYIKKCVWLRWRMRNTESGKKKPRNNDDDDDSEDDFYKNQNKKIHWNHPTLTEINQKWWLFILFFSNHHRQIYCCFLVCVCVCMQILIENFTFFFKKKCYSHFFFWIYYSGDYFHISQLTIVAEIVSFFSL